jgi:hypothetical protein
MLKLPIKEILAADCIHTCEHATVKNYRIGLGAMNSKIEKKKMLYI